MIDGIKERRFHIALVGAMMVAALALTLDGLLALAGGYRCRAPGGCASSPRLSTNLPQAVDTPYGRQCERSPL